MTIESVRITVLVDNKGGAGLVAEHGLSLWVEAGRRNILFDTGQGKTLMYNARRLGVPLEKTDMLVLSHGHYDHTGGMAKVLKVAPKVRVILHLGAVITRFSVGSGKPPKAIGMPPSIRSALERSRNGGITWAVRPLQLASGIGVTGPIPRETAYEDVGGPFFLDPRGEKKDPIEDDQALWISTPEGLIVCVGCSHAGLINTLNYVQRVSGIFRIRAVIGGFHLLHADTRRLEMTVAALRSLDPGMLAPCHCTGEKAARALKAAFGAKVSCCHSGINYRFASGTKQEKK